MSVYFCIPSARPPAEVEPVLVEWRRMGYKIALWRDSNGSGMRWDLLRGGAPYPGYAQAVNALVAEVLKQDPACDWIVTGGDDTFPDPNKTADEIARECWNHFYIFDEGSDDLNSLEGCGSFGVMQPTGDRFAHGSIDRIAGSPWLGREWCLRANQGQGPFWPEFTHMFGDECLKRTAEKLGVYWVRPDLTHFHQHFMRESDAIDAKAVPSPMPAHLKQWNTQEHWDQMKTIFQRLERQDFAPCMPTDVPCAK